MWSDLGDKSWPIIRLETEWEAKVRDDISYENCVTSEAVSDLIGKASIHPEKVSTRVSMGEGNGNPLHCSCLENPGDGGAWWAAVYAFSAIIWCW